MSEEYTNGCSCGDSCSSSCDGCCDSCSSSCGGEQNNSLLVAQNPKSDIKKVIAVSNIVLKYSYPHKHLNKTAKNMSGKYSLIQKKSVSPNVDFDLVANAEEEIENGGIVVGIRDNKEQGNQKNKILRTGSFKLIRTDEESEYAEWNEILTFKLFNQEAPYTLFTDYTVKQGVKSPVPSKS